MPAIASQLDPRSPDFTANAAYHRVLVQELDRRLARAADGGGEKARNRHTERGKLLARDRITALLDPGSPFLRSPRSPPRTCTTGLRPRPAWCAASAA